MSQQHNIIVNKTANYYVSGDIKKAKTLWFVLHGYGFLAKYFIEKFNPILTPDIAIIAPEALSKFYLGGVEGKVGASWMTKENREEEITDYVNYLNQLYKLVLELNNTSNVKINIFGFSQGGATASRWVGSGKIKCDNFILWASIFPENMDFKEIAKTNSFFLYGDDDKYVTEKRIATQKKIFKQSGIAIRTTIFKGKHDVPASVLVEQTKVNGW